MLDSSSLKKAHLKALQKQSDYHARQNASQNNHVLKVKKEPTFPSSSSALPTIVKEEAVDVKREAEPVPPPPTPPTNQRSFSSASSSSVKLEYKAQHRGQPPPTFSITQMQVKRARPMPILLKIVMDYLSTVRQPLTTSKILLIRNLDLSENDKQFHELLEQLRKKPTVHYDSETDTYTYQSKYTVRNKTQLLHLVSDSREGIVEKDLADAYPNSLEDVKALINEKQIMAVPNSDLKCSVLFPREHRYHLEVDEQFISLWKETEVPDEVDTERALEQAQLGAMGTVRTAVVTRRSDARGPAKKKRRTRKTKLTNTHLDGLFDLSKDYLPAGEGPKES
eukprot:GCRY01004443.1.p1 GENE.GCRY01004443.1~~GCRY01004443.1.p1  ORF type:complete len:337 (+),score=85.06 GCRY01004443.1:178-1188(+)